MTKFLKKLKQLTYISEHFSQMSVLKYSLTSGMLINDGIDRPNPDERPLVAGRDYIQVNRTPNNPSDTENNIIDDILARKELLGNSALNLKIDVAKLVICFVASVAFII